MEAGTAGVQGRRPISGREHGNPLQSVQLGGVAAFGIAFGLVCTCTAPEPFLRMSRPALLSQSLPLSFWMPRQPSPFGVLAPPPEFTCQGVLA